MNFQDFEELLIAAPTVAMVMLCIYVGWWARGKSAQVDSERLRTWFEFIKNLR